MKAAFAVPDQTSISFRRYIYTRKYHQGRGSNAGWEFVSHVLGDPNFPNPSSWQELRGYLLRYGAPQPMLEAANTVWRSFGAFSSKARKAATTEVFLRGPAGAFNSERATSSRGRVR